MHMPALSEIVRYLDQTLAIAAIPGDKSNNGLQVSGATTVRRVIGGVDGCLALYEAAAAAGGDLIVVHHGESWGSGYQYFTGRIGDRLRCLYRHDLSLYAAHLPLDAHPTLGHNAQIAARLQLTDRQPFAEYCGALIGVHGLLPQPLSLAALRGVIDTALNTTCQAIAFGPEPITRLAVVSGSGAGALAAAQAAGCQALLTGDVGHTDYHVIRELGGTLITGGHYRTECPGVLAVLDRLADQFGVETRFIDIPTGL